MYVDDSHSEGSNFTWTCTCMSSESSLYLILYILKFSQWSSIIGVSDWMNDINIFTVICFQSLKCVCQEGKSQHVWNKNIIPWEVLNWFLFMSCNASKNSLVSCAHSFVFFNALQLLNKNCWCTLSWNNLNDRCMET